MMLRKFFVAFFGAVYSAISADSTSGNATSAATAALSQIIPASDSAIKYFGRWDDSESGGRTACWTAAYVKLGFNGSKLGVDVGTNVSSFSASVDGGKEIPFLNQKGVVVVTSQELPTGEHQIRLVQKAGQNFTFRGVKLEQCAKLVPAKTGETTVLFIGDSITYGAVASDPTLEGWAWAPVKELGVEEIRIAQGGIGLVSGYDAPLGTVGMDKQFFKQDMVGKPAAAKNYPKLQSDKPDVIVINLGTNDGNKNETNPVPMDIFSETYASFLRNLRRIYPDADILALEIFNTYAKDKNQAIADAVKAAADPKITLVSTAGWVNPAPSGGDIAPDWSHPTNQGHAKLGARIVQVLKPYVK